MIRTQTEKAGNECSHRKSGSTVSCSLTALDWFLTFFTLSPLCILFWRGLWQYIDCLVVFPKAYGSPWVSTIVGHCVCVLLTSTQECLILFFVDSNRLVILKILLSRIYTTLYAFGLVNQWRGVWQLLDFYLGKSWMSCMGVVLVGVFVLGILRALRNIMAPPLTVATDVLDVSYARSSTMLKSFETKKSKVLRVVDVAVSVVVISSLVVFVWRGIWTMLDVFLFPESPSRSGWTSLAIGYAIVLLSYSLQYGAASFSGRLKSNLVRILFEDVFILVASVGAINVWRGIWLLADTYVYPDDYLLSNWLTALVGLTGSVLLFAGNTILARGVTLDGDLKDGSGCLFRTDYLRKLFKPQRKRQVSRSTQEDGCVLDNRRLQGKLNGQQPWGVVDSQSLRAAERLLVADGKTNEVMVVTERETVV